MKQRYKSLLVLFALWGGFFAIIFLVDPLNTALPLLILPFLLLFAAVYQTLKLFLQRLAPNMSSSRRNAAILVSAIVPTILLVLSSVRQLTLRDVLLIAALLLLASFYVKKSHLFER
jgi:hypothetical protein